MEPSGTFRLVVSSVGDVRKNLRFQSSRYSVLAIPSRKFKIVTPNVVAPDGSRTPGAGSKKDGRPTEDRQAKAQRILKDFEVSEEADKQFYGDLYKNFERTLSRTYNDLQSEAAVNQQAVVLLKQVSSMMSVLKKHPKERLVVAGRVPDLQSPEGLLVGPTYDYAEVSLVHAQGYAQGLHRDQWANAILDALGPFGFVGIGLRSRGDRCVSGSLFG